MRSQVMWTCLSVKSFRERNGFHPDIPRPDKRRHKCPPFKPREHRRILAVRLNRTLKKWKAIFPVAVRYGFPANLMQDWNPRDSPSINNEDIINSNRHITSSGWHRFPNIWGGKACRVVGYRPQTSLHLVAFAFGSLHAFPRPCLTPQTLFQTSLAYHAPPSPHPQLFLLTPTWHLTPNWREISLCHTPLLKLAIQMNCEGWQGNATNALAEGNIHYIATYLKVARVKMSPY